MQVSRRSQRARARWTGRYYGRVLHSMLGSVSKVEMVTPMALTYKVSFPFISTFETPPPRVAVRSRRWPEGRGRSAVGGGPSRAAALLPHRGQLERLGQEHVTE